ncbi:MAG: NAD(P)-dependent oxidoreductase [Gemmatimonadota bacterium]
MRFFPVGLDLQDRPCVVVGGGLVGTRKVFSLRRGGARVTVVAPAITEELADEVEAGRVEWRQCRFEPEHLEGARLVVVATGDPEVNERVAELARRSGALLCDATAGERSDVIFGALLEEDGLTIATFTDGRDPGRARRTRDQIAEWLSSADHEEGDQAWDGASLLVLVAHGSRDPAWAGPLEELTRQVGERTGRGSVRLAFSQFESPTLEDVVADAAGSGIRTIRVLPLFMTAGGHVERDIRPVVDELRRDYEPIEIELLPPVGELPSFRILLVELAREVTR